MTDDDAENPAVLAEVDFPSGTPREDCVAAVVAARDLIHERDGATRDEIVTELEPLTEFPLGHNALAAKKIGEGDQYREWWWKRVVEPGLRVLPDVEGSAGSPSKWRPADDSVEP